MTGRPIIVTGRRVTHERAAVADLERAAPDDPEARLEDLLAREGVAEAFVLGTCNRVEEYVVTPDEAAGREALADFAPDVPRDAVVEMDHEESLRHLLRVAAGLESQVLGEDQILGQVRSAYVAAQDASAIGPALEPGLLKAIHVGERARTETAINDGTVSIGSAAVELVGREHDLESSLALVVGAGKMARLVAEALADAGTDRLRILNRSPDRAAALADALSVPARWGGLDTLAEGLRESDVVVSSTGSPDPVIEADHAADAGETLIVDIAQPRDVADGVGDARGVTVRDLDGLEAITRATHEDRREAAAAVEAIVEEEFDLLMDQYKRRRADAVIAAMYRGAERIKERELSRATSKLDLAADDREVVESLADALVSQLMAVPTESLRDAAAQDDWATIGAAIELFDPNLDDDAFGDVFSPGGVTGEAPADGTDDE